jgi:hypothetical protein
MRGQAGKSTRIPARQVFGKPCFPNAKRLAGKGLCFAPLSAAGFGGISEQASIAVDMGKFSVLATFLQLIPCARSLRASSRRFWRVLCRSRTFRETPG